MVTGRAFSVFAGRHDGASGRDGLTGAFRCRILVAAGPTIPTRGGVRAGRRGTAHRDGNGKERRGIAEDGTRRRVEETEEEEEE